MAPVRAKTSKKVIVEVIADNPKSYNLPSDEANAYPKFNSFEEREEFICKKLRENPQLITILKHLGDSKRKLDNERIMNEVETLHKKKSELAAILEQLDPQFLEKYQHVLVADEKEEKHGPKDKKAQAQQLQTVLVGDKNPEFVPQAGDFVLSHPRMGQPLNPDGFLTTFNPFLNDFQPCQGHLVVRLGSFEKGVPEKFKFNPYQNLELHYTNKDNTWTYLGHQQPMKNTQIPSDISPGKHLRLGSPVFTTKSGKYKPLIPRRGDVVIKSAAWIENFPHQQNFRRSMVKWHRDRPIQWAQGDMVLRLFIDEKKYHNPNALDELEDEEPNLKGEKPPLNFAKPALMQAPLTSLFAKYPMTPIGSDPPRFWGFAELYCFEGPKIGFVFWGTTMHHHFYNYATYTFRLLRYTSDDGNDSDSEN